MLVLGGLLFAAMANEVLLSWRTRFGRSKAPPRGQALDTPPLQVTIKYDAPIEKLFASLQVLGRASKDEAMGAADMSSDQSTLAVKVNALKPGDYTVKWRVVGIDSHQTHGSYSFTVPGTKLSTEDKQGAGMEDGPCCSPPRPRT
jgi:methionine-rich copper-binding protein CopC